jgi:hypothetical protein
MTPRTFFTIFLKITGLFLLSQTFYVLPQLITGLYSIFSDSGIEDSLWELIPALVMLALLIALMRLCFFKTDYLIDKLALDKHFNEDKFEINIHRSTVIKLSIIVIGTLMIIDSIPNFSQHLFIYIQTKRYGFLQDKATSSGIIINGVKILLGFALVVNSRLILNVIEKYRRA